MNHAGENASLTTDFLGLAGQARRLLNTDEHQTSYDTTQLVRFKLIYRDELEKLWDGLMSSKHLRWLGLTRS